VIREAILLGSKPASVVALLHLLGQGWVVKEVVASPSQPDWLPPPSLHDVATKLGIRVVEHQDELMAADVDLVVSYMCRSLVTERTRARGKYALNFHAGPLPEFGGWAFYNVAILEGASQYGCTCHLMDDGFDTGPIVEVRRFEIDAAAETAVSLEKKAQEEMILLFMRVVSNYEQNGSLRFQHQDPEQMRYLDAQQFQTMKQIPLDANEEVVDRIARAFWYPPYDVAYYQMPNGTKLEVIPAIAKNALAKDIHKNDLQDLLKLTGLPLNL